MKNAEIGYIHDKETTYYYTIRETALKLAILVLVSNQLTDHQLS